MNEYPLEKLLVLRERRKDEATDNVRHIQNKIRHEVELLETLNKNLADYKEWKDEEINRRYNTIIDTIKTQDELISFNQGIAGLSTKEDEIQCSIVTKQKEIDDLQLELSKALEIMHSAQKSLQKIESHKNLFKERIKKELLYKEELELEDFKVKSKTW